MEGPSKTSERPKKRLDSSLPIDDQRSIASSNSDSRYGKSQLDGHGLLAATVSINPDFFRKREYSRIPFRNRCRSRHKRGIILQKIQAENACRPGNKSTGICDVVNAWFRNEDDIVRCRVYLKCRCATGLSGNLSGDSSERKETTNSDGANGPVCQLDQTPIVAHSVHLLTSRSSDIRHCSSMGRSCKSQT